MSHLTQLHSRPLSSFSKVPSPAERAYSGNPALWTPDPQHSLALPPLQCCNLLFMASAGPLPNSWTCISSLHPSSETVLNSFTEVFWEHPRRKVSQTEIVYCPSNLSLLLILNPFSTSNHHSVLSQITLNQNCSPCLKTGIAIACCNFNVSLKSMNMMFKFYSFMRGQIRIHMATALTSCGSQTHRDR